MINNLRSLIKPYKTNEEKYNFLREYLQELILKIIDRKGYFNSIAFVGGTALRILENIERFSEDLDFSMYSKDNFHFSDLVETIVNELQSQNLKISTSIKNEGNVKNCFIKFQGLLYELNLSNQKNQNLSVKLEVDTNPPKGYKLKTTYVTRKFGIEITHFDLPSLFAGKCHAILFRGFTKGRDYFDLRWFISRTIFPNLVLFNNAVKQTENSSQEHDIEVLKEKLIKKINETNFDHVQKDIQPLIQEHDDVKSFTKETFLAIVNQLMSIQKYLKTQGFSYSIDEKAFYDKNRATIITSNYTDTYPVEAAEAAIAINKLPKVYSIDLPNELKKDLIKKLLSN